MKSKNVLTIVLLIAFGGLISSCTNQKKDPPQLADRTTAIPPNDTVKNQPKPDSVEITAPVYPYTDEEWNKPIVNCQLPIDINGLEMEKSYPLEELIKVWGDFTKTEYWKKEGRHYWKNKGTLDIAFKTGVHNSGFEYSKQWGFRSFVLYDPRFTIYNGLISVGKPIQLFSTLGCGRLIGNLGIYTNQKIGIYYFYTNNDRKKNFFVIYTDHKGIITSIIFNTHEIIDPFEEDSDIP